MRYVPLLLADTSDPRAAVPENAEEGEDGFTERDLNEDEDEDYEMTSDDDPIDEVALEEIHDPRSQGLLKFIC